MYRNTYGPRIPNFQTRFFAMRLVPDLNSTRLYSHYSSIILSNASHMECFRFTDYYKLLWNIIAGLFDPGKAEVFPSPVRQPTYWAERMIEIISLSYPFDSYDVWRQCQILNEHACCLENGKKHNITSRALCRLQYSYGTYALEHSAQFNASWTCDNTVRTVMAVMTGEQRLLPWDSPSYTPSRKSTRTRFTFFLACWISAKEGVRTTWGTLPWIGSVLFTFVKDGSRSR